MAYDFTSIVKSGVEYQISSQNVYKPKRLQTITSNNRNGCDSITKMQSSSLRWICAIFLLPIYSICFSLINPSCNNEKLFIEMKE